MNPEYKIEAKDLVIRTLGKPTIPSPITRFLKPGVPYPFVKDEERVVFDDKLKEVVGRFMIDREVPSFECAGPREKIFFTPSKTNCAIVTCGGLCPGLNDVIRSLVLECHHRYGMNKIYGIPYGYQGFIPEYGHKVIELTPESVANIHLFGGTLLASSRGQQPTDQIVKWLLDHDVQVLFVIGGDGTLRGAMDISEEVRRQGCTISVIGIPKTIDNDIMFMDKSFGFETAFAEAVKTIACAHTEALGAPNGIGLVKLMGRHSGFIACYAALAMSDVNFVLIPEVPFALDGEEGFLPVLERRLKARRHAVVVVAEGAGQDLVTGELGTDASGNAKLKDIGLWLKSKVEDYFKVRDMEVNLKYLDPSYQIRSVPASPQDSVFCMRLAQNAVHAAMSGKTEMLVGRWHGNFVHLPIMLTKLGRRRVNPLGDLWLSVLESTGQPVSFK